MFAKLAEILAPRKIFLCFPLTSNSGEHVLELGPLVFGDLVECGSVEVDPDHFQIILVTEL